MDLLWLFGFRTRGYKRRRAAVENALANNDRDLALALLRKQEEAWGLNSANGSRDSHIRDYEHLVWVMERLAALSPTADPAIEPVSMCAAKLRNLCAARENFGLDGRMMKRDAAVVFVRLQEELRESRAAFRSNVLRAP